MGDHSGPFCCPSCCMVYNAAVMEPTTQDTQFVAAVVAHHRAAATGRAKDALAHAQLAMESAPCDREAERWHTIVADLEFKTSKTFTKVGKTVAAWAGIK